MLTTDVLEYVERSILCWLATADSDGQPNVSPKEIFAALDASSLVIANIASPGSVRNLRENPRVCVSFIDVFVQKGYKVIGRAAVVGKQDPRFEMLAAPLTEMTQGAFPIHNVIQVAASSVEQIMAPSYRLVPGTTEESQIVGAMATYGVQAVE